MLASLHLVAYQQALVVVEGTYRCTGQRIVVIKTTLQPPEPGRHNLGTHKRCHSASDMAACSGLDADTQLYAVRTRAHVAQLCFSAETDVCANR
eukprot:COSAG01_NODE_759_length_13802_cov_16.155221_14_plen_94_part_00